MLRSCVVRGVRFRLAVFRTFTDPHIELENSQFQNNCLAERRSGSGEGSHLRLIDCSVSLNRNKEDVREALQHLEDDVAQLRREGCAVQRS